MIFSSTHTAAVDEAVVRGGGLQSTGKTIALFAQLGLGGVLLGVGSGWLCSAIIVSARRRRAHATHTTQTNAATIRFTLLVSMPKRITILCTRSTRAYAGAGRRKKLATRQHD